MPGTTSTKASTSSARCHPRCWVPAASRRARATPAAAPDDAFLDLYVALVTPAGIGINVLGQTWYDQYTAGRGIDDQIILIAANAPSSVLGEDWEHAETIRGIELVQGDK